MHHTFTGFCALLLGCTLPTLAHAAVVECSGKDAEDFSVFIDGSTCSIEPKQASKPWPIDEYYGKTCTMTADTITARWKHKLSATPRKADITNYEMSAKINRSDGSFILTMTNDSDNDVDRSGGTCRRRTGDAF